MGAWLRDRLPDRVDVARMLADERFVYDTGRAVGEEHPYTPHTFVWFHRDLPDEADVPGAIHVIH
ncbi:MAG: tRNA pseudouridine32 synthase / rRNA pseudouridine746 synthase, partial [Nocardioidaceae bacterium]|nr:tRNA pseudouridine32 synthase / rRNA pseudouridine746 synthase [Nocardioidaceae bacterium]